MWPAGNNSGKLFHWGLKTQDPKMIQYFWGVLHKVT